MSALADQPPAAAAMAPGSGSTRIPWLGIAAVLLGTFISTLTGRLSSFGLADVRGAVHAGFDGGAWLTTAQTSAQMLVTPLAIWAGSIHGPRRVLLAACAVFAAASFAAPWSGSLGTLLALQVISGLGSGCFIPLTLSFILARVPRRYWTYGIALYALNIELSLNISASLEGWYIEHASWRWIYWQNVPLALAMAACLHLGIHEAPRSGATRRPDVFGLTASGAGLALIYAALDQGNRLDWLHSGVVWGLTGAGAVLLAAFWVRERRAPEPWLDLRSAFRWPLPVILTLISLLRSSVLVTAFLIPQYLGAVRGFRALQIGDTLLWLAAPQLLLCPLSGLILRHVDPRLIAACGMTFIGIAGLSVAHGLTPLWGSEQFLPSQLLQALGQSMALTGLIYACVQHMRLESALTFGAMLQTVRLMGGELGIAFIATFQRLREQRASLLIGEHLRYGDPALAHRLQAYAHGLSRLGHGQAAAAVLGRTVRALAVTRSVIDGYVALAVVIATALVVLSALSLPPAERQAGSAGQRGRA